MLILATVVNFLCALVDVENSENRVLSSIYSKYRSTAIEPASASSKGVQYLFEGAE